MKLASQVILTVALGLGGLAQLNAETLTPEQALARLDASGPRRAPGGASAPQLAMTRMTDSGAPAVYVFNNTATDGYIVVSADDVARPLLGYSDSGSLAEGDVNPALEWWLGEYTRQIEAAAAAPAQPKYAMVSSTRADWAPIEPMLTTSWDQGAPYYNQCPLVGADRTYTGCVATALAQVMNYWKYPEVGQGQISYEAESIQKRLSMNFGQRRFDWDNMLPRYQAGKYDAVQANAVAYLMKACGYAVKMDYGLDSSGALAMNISNALTRYFNYDPNITYTLRQYHSATEWATLIYENLRDVGPLMYGGGSLLGGGHSFVCDGYDGNGYFHFNWGWTGMSNGYYLLDALNPESLGTGGGGGGGYNFTQDIVLGIQPPTGKPAEERKLFLTQQGSLGGYVEDGRLVFDLFAEGGAMWVNYNPVNVKAGFGATFEPIGLTKGETLKAVVSDSKYDISPGYGTDPAHLKPVVDLAQLNLPTGTYKVTMCTFNPEDETEEWVPVRSNHGYYNYFTIRHMGDDYTVTVNDVPGLGITHAEIVGRLVSGCQTTFKVAVTNINDIELTKGIAPVFIYNNAMCFLGESIMVTVAPGETVEREWTTDVYALQGAPNITEDTELLFTFFDESTYMPYDDDFITKVTMEANPGPPTLAIWTGGEPKVRGASAIKEMVNGQVQTVYQVTDKENIEIMAYVGVEKGYFQYPMIAAICSEDPENPGYLSLETYAAKSMTISANNVRTRVDLSIPFAEGREGELYYIMMGYGYNGEIYQAKGNLGYFRIVGDAAVDDVIADGGLSLAYDKATRTVKAVSGAEISLIEAYDMAGQLIATSGSETLDLGDCPRGIVVVRAVNADGETAVLKIAI